MEGDEDNQSCSGVYNENPKKMIDQEWAKGPHWCSKGPPLNIEVEKLNILTKQRQIFTKLEVYVNIDLPSYLILFGGVQCSCYCMHARQVGWLSKIY